VIYVRARQVNTNRTAIPFMHIGLDREGGDIGFAFCTFALQHRFNHPHPGCNIAALGGFKALADHL